MTGSIPDDEMQQFLEQLFEAVETYQAEQREIEENRRIWRRMQEDRLEQERIEQEELEGRRQWEQAIASINARNEESERRARRRGGFFGKGLKTAAILGGSAVIGYKLGKKLM